LEIRLVFSATVLVLVLAAFRRDLLRIQSADWPDFLLLGAVGLVMVQLTCLHMINLTALAMAVFLQYLAPIIVSDYLMLVF
jgi:drug/metabolite transporter (DMT)-like permease